MQITFSTLAILVLSLSTSGCFLQMSNRSCPGFEDRTVIADWAPYVIGNKATFSNQEGEMLTLQLDQIIDSEPYSNSGSGSDASLSCKLISEYIFTVSDTPHILNLRYKHLEFSDKELEEERLTAEVLLQETRDVEHINSRFIFFLRPLELNSVNIEDDGIESFYHTSMNIDGIDYQDVINYNKVPGDRKPFNLSEDKLFRIKRVIFSRFAGITALEYEDGRLYTLVH